LEQKPDINGLEAELRQALKDLDTAKRAEHQAAQEVTHQRLRVNTAQRKIDEAVEKLRKDCAASETMWFEQQIARRRLEARPGGSTTRLLEETAKQETPQ
jgi:hypothetical protein